MSVKRLAYLLLLSLFTAGCAANMNVADKVVADVGGKKITYGDFEQQYRQNVIPNSDSANAISSKKNFLDLLVNYNLKLLDARRAHLLEQPAVRSEMESYEAQLAVGYILEHEITDPMVRKIYERRKFEVRAQQVFIRFKPDSAFPQGDTLKAYNEAMNVIRDLKRGAPIDSLIHLYLGGDTYYITAGTFLRYQGGEGFENMLYSLKPGEVGSVPIRTAFGYLVVKLEQKRPRVESVRASHILIQIKGATPADTLEAYNKAVAILDSARSGVSFAKLAEDNSADTVSGRRGGDLGWVTRGMMVRPFDEALFNMNKVGEMVGPVRTRFGYHIIKLTGIRPVPPFADVESELRTNYLNTGYQYDYQNFVAALKNKYSFRLNRPAVALLDSTLKPSVPFSSTDFDSLLTPSELKDSLFMYDNEVGTVDTVIAITRSKGKFSAAPMTPANIDKMVEDAGSDMVLMHYAVAKARTYPEFDSLMTKYEDGIMIYQIEQQEVWSKVAKSDSVLKPYFLAHASKYVWPRRADLSKIGVSTRPLADSLYGLLQKGANFDTLAARFDVNKELKKEAGHWGLFPDSTNALAIAAFRMKEGEFSAPIFYDGLYSIVKVNKFVPPEPKTFEEARGEVSADYQQYESNKLQTEWLDRLRQEFGVKIYEKTFDELVSKE